MGADLALRSRRVVLPDGERAATVVVRDGTIDAIHEHAAPTNASVTDLGDLVLLPGLVDSHVHVNEPGRTEWEGFTTATRAAAAGGITTIVDMPLNSIPPTVDVTALHVKQRAANDQAFVDIAFWGGAVPDNLGSLKELHDAGVVGVKCFTVDSGVPEFPRLDWPMVREALTELAAFDGLLAVHAEDVTEARAVERLVELLRDTGARAHVVHVSAADAAQTVADARADGVRITAETCPHYLTLTAEEATNTSYKCCPPIRDAENRERLWPALADGTLDCVVSDHSPSPPSMKTGDFASAWGGISSLQLGLSVVWAEANRRGHDLTDVARWMAQAPARLCGLPRKGSIAVGNDADLVAFAPDDTWVVDPRELLHRHPLTPYAGRRVRGRVLTTWLRGTRVDTTPRGRLLTREVSS